MGKGVVRDWIFPCFFTHVVGATFELLVGPVIPVQDVLVGAHPDSRVNQLAFVHCNLFGGIGNKKGKKSEGPKWTETTLMQNLTWSKAR